MQLPVIDVSPLVTQSGDRDAVARQMREACLAHGFFYVAHHGVDPALQARLERAAHAFFALSDERKARVRMALAGRAWRGWFPVGGELTSGVPDLKEGLYFGTELPPDDPRVEAGRPLHGPNLFPDDVPELRPATLAWLDALTQLGHALMEGLARSLGLAPDFFRTQWMQDPTVLFRIFHYPPERDVQAAQWGVGEHTDYGVLTILLQDEVGGLQVKSPAGWIEAPPVPGTFVCNIGDMLDRMTGGLYRSTPHRVRNASGRDRFSYPFFFDPSWDAAIERLPVVAGALPDDAHERWDRASVHAFEGSYGDYLLGKVGKVFPDLGREVIR